MFDSDRELDGHAIAIIDRVEALARTYGYPIDLYRARALVQVPDRMKTDPVMTLSAVHEAIGLFLRFHFPTDAFGRPVPTRRRKQPVA
jgi:hypothetical protein